MYGAKHKFYLVVLFPDVSFRQIRSLIKISNVRVFLSGRKVSDQYVKYCITLNLD